MNGIYHYSALHTIRTMQVQYFSDSLRFEYTDLLSYYCKTEVEVFCDCLDMSYSIFILLTCMFTSVGFAFVYFEDERDGNDAIRALDGYPFGPGRRRLSVEWSRVIPYIYSESPTLTPSGKAGFD